MERVSFSGSKTILQFRAVNDSSRASCTSKILRLFCKEKSCKKTLYSGIELICEFPKQCLRLLHRVIIYGVARESVMF